MKYFQDKCMQDVLIKNYFWCYDEIVELWNLVFFNLVGINKLYFQ